MDNKEFCNNLSKIQAGLFKYALNLTADTQQAKKLLMGVTVRALINKDTLCSDPQLDKRMKQTVRKLYFSRFNRTYHWNPNFPGDTDQIHGAMKHKNLRHNTTNSEQQVSLTHFRPRPENPIIDLIINLIRSN